MMKKLRVLTLPLKAEYFDAIRAGEKFEEYRLITPFWQRRIENRAYDKIVLTKGYPRADDTERRMELQWLGYRRKRITHPHFGDAPVDVYAIAVDRPEAQP